MDLLCICSEEWCYCTATIRVDLASLDATAHGTPPEVACDDCANGRHVMTNDSRFAEKVAEHLVAHG